MLTRIEAGGINIMEIRVKPGSQARMVILDKPVVRSELIDRDDYDITAFTQAITRERECRFLNGLFTLPFPPEQELVR